MRDYVYSHIGRESYHERGVRLRARSGDARASNLAFTISLTFRS